MTKQALREELRALRSEITPTNKALWDRQIFQRAHKDRSFQLAHTVHIFRSTPSEIDTLPFIEYAWGIGKRVAVPRVDPTGDLTHVVIDRDTQWTEGPFGILEPTMDKGAVVLPDTSFDSKTAVIVPMLAFNKLCHRLGYGKGYYDRFLSRSSAATIGIAYEFQKRSDLPVEDHDQPLNRIATNERWYQPTSGNADR